MMMKDNELNKQSRLIHVLREGVTVVQMILFKEIRDFLARKYPNQESSHLSVLAGTITNELFNTVNPDEKFKRFRNKNRGVIEQELLGLAEEFPQLRGILSDALRIQTLCDSQEGNENPDLLKKANELGILIAERDIPLPSIFMTRVRELGADHNLIMPPVQIDAEEDQIVH